MTGLPVGTVTRSSEKGRAFLVDVKMTTGFGFRV